TATLGVSGSAYTVDYYYPDSGNFVSADDHSQTLTITQAVARIQVTPYTSATTTYDGKPHTALGIATGVNGEDLSALVDLTGTTHTNAGTYADDGWSFHDAGGNYADARGTVTDSIARADAGIQVAPYSVTYDSTAHTATGTATGVGGVDL